jgi:predicted Zn-dependent protease
MPKVKASRILAREIMLMLESGHVYRYAGRFREASEIFHGVRAMIPEREVSYLALAALCLDEGKLDDAGMYCQHALKAVPTSAAAYVQLGEIQLHQNKRGDAARSLRHSIELSPDGPVASLAQHLLKVVTTKNTKVPR